MGRHGLTCLPSPTPSNHMESLCRLLLLVLTVIISASAVEPSKSVGHPSTLVEMAPIVASFGKLSDLLKTVSAEANLAVFEGLPHQTWSADALKSELETEATVQRYGFPFYQRPYSVSQADLVKLRNLTTRKGTFAPFSGWKLCGGFHPDFSLVWTKGEETLEIHLCFGCDEIRAYRGKSEVYCENDGSDEFAAILSAYRSQRPKIQE